VVDLGALQVGAPFFVMQLVDGPSLAAATERRGDARWALPLLAQVADALAAMHARGIVHRDLKPGNVLIADGIARVADFGIARLYAANAADDVLTRTGELFGTPAYMAPELADGIRSAGPGSDMFSFGVLTYELLSGKLPHALPPVFARRQGMPAPEFLSLVACRPDLPPDFAALVDACLREEVAERPDAVRVAAVLRAVAFTTEPERPEAIPA
jgi:serine/threonine-protein kinase